MGLALLCLLMLSWPLHGAAQAPADAPGVEWSQGTPGAVWRPVLRLLQPEPGKFSDGGARGTWHDAPDAASSDLLLGVPHAIRAHGASTRPAPASIYTGRPLRDRPQSPRAPPTYLG